MSALAFNRHDRCVQVSELIGSTLLRVAGLTVVTGGLGGCFFFGCPDERNFGFEADLTAELIDDLLITTTYEDPEERELGDLTCEDVCLAYLAERGDDYDRASVSECSYNIDDFAAADDSDEERSEIVVGNVQCSGRFTPVCEGGRRPLGHIEETVDHADPLGRSLAASAHMEAASVTAFVQLRRQLERWGAPASLVERCAAAARDEVHHARLLTALAEARGAAVPRPKHARTGEGLLEVALHNATEGCVGEAWAALLAHHQAVHASTPQLRAAYETIAADETRHGQLAWDLHRWLLDRLDASDRQRVREAQASALARLGEKARVQAEALPAALGCPASDLAGRLAEAFSEALLASAA